ncbi:MAG: hypothetical protein ABIJ26_01515 [Candidatus Margulisiibacteriota bacterium]|nr:hypothetical protein [Candidatus Margulisiibacteriota bacterium]
MSIIRGLTSGFHIPRLVRPAIRRVENLAGDALKLAPKMAFKALTIATLPISLPIIVLRALSLELSEVDPPSPEDPNDFEDPVI